MDMLEIYNSLDALGRFLGIIIGILLGFLLFMVIVYICTGIAYYKAAEAEGIPNRWLAWIPIGNSYIMLRLAEKNINLLFIFIASMASTIIRNFYDIGAIFNLISFAITIVSIIISIQCYLVIGKKYGISSAWFIVGCFIIPVMIVPMIMLYNKAKKIVRGEATLNIVEEDKNNEEW